MLSVDRKHVQAGSRIPRFERVFNRIGILTQSLYARARVGIVYQVQKPQNGPHFGPLHLPLDPTITAAETRTYTPTRYPYLSIRPVNIPVASCHHPTLDQTRSLQDPKWGTILGVISAISGGTDTLTDVIHILHT